MENKSGHTGGGWLKAVKKSVDAYNEHIEDEKLNAGWERLQKEFAAPRRGFAPNKTRVFFWSSVAAAAVVALALLIFPLYKPDTKQNIEVAANYNSSGSFIGIDSSRAVLNNSSPGIRVRIGVQPAEAQGVAEKSGVARMSVHDISAVNSLSGMIADNDYAPAMQKNKPIVVLNNRKSEIVRNGLNRPGTGDHKRRNKTFEIGESVRVSSTGKWVAGLMMGGAAGSGKDNGSSSALSASLPLEQGNFFALAQTFAVSLSPADYSHKQPVSFGFTVERKFGNAGKLSIESGIVYSLLNSDVTSGAYNLRQHLHYLGIPVAVKWNFVNKEKFKVYADGGGMVEKGIAGRMENIDNKRLKSGHFSIKGLQFSVAADVGAEYKIYRNIGIYIQPGVSYYFKPKDMGTFFINSENTGSVGGSSGSGRAFQLESIRSNNRIGLDIQAGIRLSY